MAKYYRHVGKSPEGRGVTQYTAISSDESRGADRPASTVSVYHAQEIPLVGTDPDTGEEIDPWKVGYRNAPESAHRNVGQASEHANALVEQQGQEPQLFHHVPAHFEHARSDPSMRATFPTLLGIALKEHGGKVQVPDSLSQYSSRIAKKGKDLGVVTGDSEPSRTHTESLQRFNREVNPSGNYIDTRQYPPAEIAPMSENEVTVGRNFARTTLRPRKWSKQFDALQKLEQGGAYDPRTDPGAMSLFGEED